LMYSRYLSHKASDIISEQKRTFLNRLSTKTVISLSHADIILNSCDRNRSNDDHRSLFYS
jgi:hypothetical protein